MRDHLFVYDDMMPGRKRWPILEGGSWPVRVSSATGKLFDTGYGFIGATFNALIEDRIPGVVVGIDTRDLETIDLSQELRSSLLRRIRIVVDGQWCWAYEWWDDTDTFTRIESGGCYTPPMTVEANTSSENSLKRIQLLVSYLQTELNQFLANVAPPEPAPSNAKKLSAGDAESIRMWHAMGYTNKGLAEMYEVHPSTISRIVRGVYWK